MGNRNLKPTSSCRKVRHCGVRVARSKDFVPPASRCCVCSVLNGLPGGRASLLRSPLPSSQVWPVDLARPPACLGGHRLADSRNSLCWGPSLLLGPHGCCPCREVSWEPSVDNGEGDGPHLPGWRGGWLSVEPMPGTCEHAVHAGGAASRASETPRSRPCARRVCSPSRLSCSPPCS